MDENIKKLLVKHVPDVEVPHKRSEVYKDECVYSFDTPFTDTGLYVCLKTHYGIGKEHLLRHYKKTGSCVYLHIKHEKVYPESKTKDAEVTRLAIGVEGGFDVATPKFEVKKSYSIVLLPEFIVYLWPDPDLPEKIIQSVHGILNADPYVNVLSEKNQTWDGEVLFTSKYAANLVQLNNGKRIPPSGWKCEKCDLTANLWLNLTDGSILCGRRFFDGSGGNNHAAEHYEITRYPLAVKLGTITKDGKADVYSYAEDYMVNDPNLKQHLAHFGINMGHMEKSDRSMAELEIDLNKKVGEWAAIQEAGSNLQPLYGPGYTGLNNLGNSCYMNSLMQVLFGIPDFIQKYVHESDAIFDDVRIDNPANDFNAQTAKLGVGLWSGKYSTGPSAQNEHEVFSSVSPHMFKAVVGKGSYFANKEQQDVQEFFLHIISVVQRNVSYQGGTDPSECFRMKIEDRFECSVTSEVQYTYRDEYCLSLPIPLETAQNTAAVNAYLERKSANPASDEEPVRPLVSLQSCIDAFIQTESVDQFYSSALGAKTIAYKATKVFTFPRYMILHLKKYTLGADWSPIKLDVSLDVPDVLDLSVMLGKGVQSGEQLMRSSSQPKNAGPKYNKELVADLMNLGISHQRAICALIKAKNDLEQAADWAFGSEMDFEVEEESENDGSDARQMPIADDSQVTRYRLIAFISHMGTSTSVGHYVAHLMRDGQWVIFNDEKVARSENPPKNFGYLYVYERF